MSTGNGQNLSVEILSKMEDTVRLFVQDGRAFTTYNVTLATRQREALELRHKWVQDAGNPVHDFPSLREAIDFADYRQTRRDHPSGDGRWALLYHPANYDPANFQWEDAQRPDPAQVRDSVSQAAYDQQVSDDAVAQAADAGGAQPDGTYKLDYRNRLFIPTQFLRDIGLEPYKTCYVVADSDEQAIHLTADANQYDDAIFRVTTQVVERDGDIRLSSTTLKSAGLEGDSFKIGITDNSVEIRLV